VKERGFCRTVAGARGWEDGVVLGCSGTARQRRPGGSDGREDDAVPGRRGDSRAAWNLQRCRLGGRRGFGACR
jgi:hypothetical protein